jgi:hypothetical protein
VHFKYILKSLPSTDFFQWYGDPTRQT